MNRFFVTVYAKGADDLRRLQKHELDVFAHTAKKVDAHAEGSPAAKAGFGFAIEGLLSSPEVETLVKDGYRVLVEDTVEARSQPSGKAAEFADWLERMKPLIAKDKTVRR